MRSQETSDQSSFFTWAQISAESRAVLMGLASQATAASSRFRFRACSFASATFLPRS